MSEMEPAEKFDGWQRLARACLIIGFVAVACGYNLDARAILLIGVLLIGAALLGQAALSLAVVRQLSYENAKERLAGAANAYFAFCQLLLGVGAIFGAVAEAVSEYVSSGAFWRDVTETVSPLVLLFVFGLFLATTGAAQIVSRLSHRSYNLKAFLENLHEVLQGIVFLVFGLFFVVLILFVKVFGR